MLPDRLQYLTRLNNFIEVLTEQAKQKKLNERDFLLMVAVKAKSMAKEAKYRKKPFQN